MSKASAQVTAAEISRLAGVTRATVSNWRRRHEDFPAPNGGTDSSPLYDLNAVRAWLRARGQASTATPAGELRATLRLHSGDGTLVGRLLPLVLAAAHLSASAVTKLSELDDADLAARACETVAHLADDHLADNRLADNHLADNTVPGADDVQYVAEDARALRALLHCVRDDSAQSALDVLAERELENSASPGTYHTPPQLADLMARLLAPPNGPYPKRVLDPACGSGTLLTSAALQGASVLLGQDRLPVQAQRSAVRLLLHSPDADADADVTVRAGDSLRADAFTDVMVNGVLCNPPYGDRDWGHDDLAHDRRWMYGAPARAESELAWVQHSLSHLAAGGLAVMLLPPSVAARTSGRRVRSELLRGGAVRAVIALPPKIAAPLHIGLHLWILERPRPGGPARDTVLFMETSGSERVASGWDALNAAVLSAWRAFDADPDGFASEPGTVSAVRIIDLLDEFVDLTPARHVRTAVPADPATAASKAVKLTKRLAGSVASLTVASTLGEWCAAGDEPRGWRTATVADLAHAGALTLYRATRGSEVLAKHTGRPVLTGHDLATGGRATGDANEIRPIAPTIIAPGDVLLSSVLDPRGAASKVADDEDAKCLLGPNVHLLRANAERLDPWFLVGFLGAPDNVNRASSGTSTVHLDVRRLRVPLLPLDEQRRYGRAFRRLHELRTAIRQADEAATQAAKLLSAGLTTGSLLPPTGDPT
ncbi:N-6 DNA methylase [Actinomadura sp. 9N407]|uniref:N-6 DNA methylase n=1 Tax=Actinomadura sp. 9N407 TaxID=3375154 RepID=UPI003790C7D8